MQGSGPFYRDSWRVQVQETKILESHGNFLNEEPKRPQVTYKVFPTYKLG
jgi:hypothetical protein